MAQCGVGSEAKSGSNKAVNRSTLAVGFFNVVRFRADTVKTADPGAIILHCLPAHYGEEIDYETSRLPNSAIFDQAENRMHAQNALMVHLAG